MSLLKSLKSYFSKDKPEDLCKCGKKKIRSKTPIQIRGVTYTFTTSPKCRECTEVYLNKYSTECAVCGDPIIPGEAVGVSGKPDLPYVHMTFDCTDTGGQLCGRWGEGKLEPLFGDNQDGTQPTS